MALFITEAFPTPEGTWDGMCVAGPFPSSTEANAYLAAHPEINCGVLFSAGADDAISGANEAMYQKNLKEWKKRYVHYIKLMELS